MSGINDNKLKIGSDFIIIVKCKVYLFIQNREKKNYGSYLNQWAFCNGKIYQKFNRARGSIDSNIIIHYKSSVI